MAGGQTVKAPFESLFCEMEYGRPMKLSPKTEEELKQAGLIQEAAPLPWRDEELKTVVRALGIEEAGQIGIGSSGES